MEPAPTTGAIYTSLYQMRLTDLVPILQMAIGPTILISGVGLLLLSMTNRLGRVIDRSRLLAEGLRKGDQSERARLSSQLEILSRRARLVRLAIILATLSALLAGVLIIALFLAALFSLEMGALVIVLFVGCIGLLICSLIVFIADLNLSLSALKLEVSSGPTSDIQLPEKIQISRSINQQTS